MYAKLFGYQRKPLHVGTFLRNEKEMAFPPYRDHERIANIFGITYNELSRLIYPNTNNNYNTFFIPKKNGAFRRIDSPKLSLLQIQRKLAEDFEALYTPKKSTHGFVKGKSIVTNADQHKNKKFVLNIDLQNFFESIHFSRVKNLLMSPPFNHSHEAATIIAQICCLNGSLPQGAPTSPIISNMICRKMDSQLQKAAYEHKCTYTRYADDITFSFNKPPHDIAYKNSDGITCIGNLLLSIIKSNGFSINDQKTRLQTRNQRQEVTGITVNKGLNLKRSFIRKTGSMLHAWKKFGAASAEREHLSKYRIKYTYPWQEKKKEGELFKNIVIGRINYIQMVRGRHDPIYRKLAYKLTEAIGKPNEDFKKAPVEVATFVVDNNFETKQGSAFLLENIGIVTNCHVVEFIDESTEDQIEFYRYYEYNKKMKASFLTSDTDKDIAIFFPSNEFDRIVPLKVGDDSKLKIGDSVTVVGFPNFSNGHSAYISSGAIVSKRRIFNITTWIINTPITHGCSGGPVLNNKHEVIGIATFGSEYSDGNTELNGFIPIAYAKEIARKGSFLKKAAYLKLLHYAPADFTLVIKAEGEHYCGICFYTKKEASLISKTREKGIFNCKFCSKLLSNQ